MAEKATITLIAALDRRRVIGADGAVPWHLRDDLRRFKELTLGKPIIMGRKTYEAIGRPLPGRRNIIMTRQEGYAAPGCEVVHSLEAALQAAGEVAEIMIGGGGDIYARFLPLADRLLLTHVDADVGGDTRFPLFAFSTWCEVWREQYPANMNNEFAFDLVCYERCQTPG